MKVKKVDKIFEVKIKMKLNTVIVTAYLSILYRNLKSMSLKAKSKKKIFFKITPNLLMTVFLQESQFCWPSAAKPAPPLSYSLSPSLTGASNSWIHCWALKTLAVEIPGGRITKFSKFRKFENFNFENREKNWKRRENVTLGKIVYMVYIQF